MGVKSRGSGRGAARPSAGGGVSRPPAAAGRNADSPGPRRAGDSRVPAWAPAPPALRDPWLWASALAVLPLLLHSLGAPLGEPVADDFDYLRHVVFSRTHSLFDGGGASLYWRPIGRQLYYTLLTPQILHHPAVVVAVHVLLLALTSVLFYRAFRLRWSGPVAATMASFPVLAESARMLIAWPSNFQDVGALLFSALALHEAMRARLRFALPALAAGLLCKEVTVIPALLLPWLPSFDRRTRGVWLKATGALVLAWGLVYALVVGAGHVRLPWQVAPAPAGAAPAAAPWIVRLGWSVSTALKSAWSLDKWGSWSALLACVALAVALGLAFARAASNPAHRRALEQQLPWARLGLVWFAIAALMLAPLYPAWAPYRNVFGAVGLGMALAPAIGAVAPEALAVLVGARLVLLGLGPGPYRNTIAEPPPSSAAIDFPKLERLERLVSGTRELLARRLPHPPPYTYVAHHHMPNMATFGFGGSAALQLWYGDSTLHWNSTEFLQPGEPRLAAIVEYENDVRRPIVFLPVEAWRTLMLAYGAIQRTDWANAQIELAQAESLAGPDASVFRSVAAGKRALVLVKLQRYSDAERETMRSLDLWRGCRDALVLEAWFHVQHNRIKESDELLDSLLVAFPGDADIIKMKQQVHGLRGP
jgi:hypothetical protein